MSSQSRRSRQIPVDEAILRYVISQLRVGARVAGGFVKAINGSPEKSPRRIVEEANLTATQYLDLASQLEQVLGLEPEGAKPSDGGQRLKFLTYYDSLDGMTPVGKLRAVGEACQLILKFKGSTFVIDPAKMVKDKSSEFTTPDWMVRIMYELRLEFNYPDWTMITNSQFLEASRDILEGIA